MDDNIYTILISCGARLAPFDIAELREIVSYDELCLDTLGDERTALFFLTTDTTYNFIVALAFSQMFNLLYPPEIPSSFMRTGNGHRKRGSALPGTLTPNLGKFVRFEEQPKDQKQGIGGMTHDIHI